MVEVSSFIIRTNAVLSNAILNVVSSLKITTRPSFKSFLEVLDDISFDLHRTDLLVDDAGAGTDFLSEIREMQKIVMETGGKKFVSSPFAKLSSSYKQRKTEAGFGNEPILTRTGDMAESMWRQDHPKHIERVRSTIAQTKKGKSTTVLTFGTSHHKAITHAFVGVFRPTSQDTVFRNPLLNIESKSVVKRLKSVFIRYADTVIGAAQSKWKRRR